MLKPRTGAVLVSAALSTATACGSSDDTLSRTGASRAAPPATTVPAASPSAANRLALARRAVRTAERRVRHSKAYDIESDRLGGRRTWEVKVARGVSRPYELDVSADGRRVVRQRRRSRVDDDVRRVNQARVSLWRALRLAGRRVARGRFDEAGIDRERGRLVWEATFEQSGDREIEVTVDARTGRVVAIDRDR
jgi:uncharacterized membrane protein YkoI